MNTHMLPPKPCPYCGKENDAVDCMTTPGAGPRPGDITICLGCENVLVFGDDGFPRKPTAEELDEISGDERVAKILKCIPEAKAKAQQSHTE